LLSVVYGNAQLLSSLCTDNAQMWIVDSAFYDGTCSYNILAPFWFIKDWMWMDGYACNRCMKRSHWQSRTLVFGCVMTHAVVHTTCTVSIVIWQLVQQWLNAVSVFMCCWPNSYVSLLAQILFYFYFYFFNHHIQLRCLCYAVLYCVLHFQATFLGYTDNCLSFENVISMFGMYVWYMH